MTLGLSNEGLTKLISEHSKVKLCNVNSRCNSKCLNNSNSLGCNRKKETRLSKKETLLNGNRVNLIAAMITNALTDN